MKYLVLKKFKCFGVLHYKGEILNEEEIRNPRLKLAEGKVVRVPADIAVPSSSKAAADISEQIEATVETVAEPEAPVEAAATKEESKNKVLRFSK